MKSATALLAAVAVITLNLISVATAAVTGLIEATVFDISVLPHAARYKALVERSRGEPKLVAETTVVDTSELLSEVCLKTDIGYYRLSLNGDDARPPWQLSVGNPR